jgi:threonine synthase
MQKAQMTTQEGQNVNVVGVLGNFDDCQTAVKKIFSSKTVADDLKKQGVVLSSANSINFGRLAPQITYYFSTYLDMVDSEEIKMGDEIDFVVPTGNFGDILAGYYAKKMGLPINRLVCASNSNNVLTEFFTNGDYDANREFFKTMSPSMDILISSNLERLIFEVSGRDADITQKRMDDLKKTGKYSVSANELEIIKKDFYADYCEEEDCLETIGDIFEEYGYVLDTHTAIAVYTAMNYKAFENEGKPMVVLSTASPYKFAQNVLKAITGKTVKEAFKSAEMLEIHTAMPVPSQIKELKTKEKRFNKVIEKDQTVEAVMEFVK